MVMLLGFAAVSALLLRLLVLTPRSSSSDPPAVRSRELRELITQWPAIEPLPHHAGEWSSVGNHRFNATLPAQLVSAGTSAVVRVVWRRSDSSPLSKAVFVRTAGSNMPVVCQYDDQATADSASFAFTPVNGEADYHFYYMPFTTLRKGRGSLRRSA